MSSAFSYTTIIPDENYEVKPKYTVKKMKNALFLKYIKPHVSTRAYEQISDCGSFLEFKANDDFSQKKLTHANFCGNSFCPMCAWRRALKETLKLDCMIRYLEDTQKSRFVFLSLTAPNVEGYALDAEIKSFNKSFKKLMAHKRVEKAFKGYVRKLEITYNKDKYITETMYKSYQKYYKPRGLVVGDRNPNYKTFHVHFHILAAVPKDYYSNYYIKRNDWLKMWQRFKNDDRITQVDVRPVKTQIKTLEDIPDENNPKQGVGIEIAKYTAKDDDYLYSQQVFDTYYRALYKKRRVVYSGVMNDAAKLYDNGKLDSYKLKDTNDYTWQLIYAWLNNKYAFQNAIELVKEE